MAVRSERTIGIVFSGDVDSSHDYDASPNSGSPGVIEFKVFNSGFTALTQPTATCKAVTIIPPVDNTLGITLKGITGDSGITLSPSEPSSIAIAGTTTSIGLTVASTINGIRLVWT